ncbi:Fatty acid oxidation complex subunit alpha [Serratia fonticola]|uniref:Fatty acid oxidation complex subunit alpha n=1 Tax=Serratia fonticola TaxID=47917 RepID=A0A3S4Z1I3_SERFO|nr:Fatty acid oxidation complex subunit alpha [Serratia fonticola]
MSFENALHEQRAKPSAFHLTLRPDNIGVITIDVPGEKVNTLKAEFVVQINDVLLKAQQLATLEGLVILSGKPDSFIAGADITMIAACHTAQEAQTLAKKGRARWHRLPRSLCRWLPPFTVLVLGAGWSWHWPAIAASARWMTKRRSACRKSS